jgi:hypothetical protein
VKIDPSKINLTEKDLQDYLWKNPLEMNGFGRVKWLGRQVKVPSGTIDLLGYVRAGSKVWLVVVEVITTDFNQAAILRACRLASDIENARYSFDLPAGLEWGYSVFKFVIGKGQPSNQMQFEANAVSVALREYGVSVSVSISPNWNFVSEFSEQCDKDLLDLASSGLFSKIKPPILPDVPEEFREFIDRLEDTGVGKIDE